MNTALHAHARLKVEFFIILLSFFTDLLFGVVQTPFIYFISPRSLLHMIAAYERKE